MSNVKRPGPALVLIAFAVVGCRREAQRGVAVKDAPALAVAEAVIPLELDAQLHVPARPAGAAKLPLLVLLHGLGSSGHEIESSDWGRFAAEHGIAFMAPSGPRDARGRRFWNAGKSCCDFEGR